MSEAGPAPASRDRFLTFEVGGAAFALPIVDVLEVADLTRIAAVPALPRAIGGVMNLHGDALPVVTRGALFGSAEEALPEPEHVLVIAGGRSETARLGLPVDRVLGLSEGTGPATRGGEMIAARLPIEGRVTSILDTERLVEQATELFAGSTNIDSERRGEEA